MAATKDAAIQCSLLPAPPVALHKVNDEHMGVTDTDNVTTEQMTVTLTTWLKKVMMWVKGKIIIIIILIIIN